jgi:hypothetical protein
MSFSGISPLLLAIAHGRNFPVPCLAGAAGKERNLYIEETGYSTAVPHFAYEVSTCREYV